MSNNNPLKSYRETQIKTATPGKLVIMLYDGAIKNLSIALDYINDGYKKNDKTNNVILKAQDIISELMVSLDFERGGEIAQNLFNLYVYMNRRLLDANIKKDAEPLKEVRKMLSDLREAWIQIVDKKQPEQTENRVSSINIAG